ncbi:MAG: hypothetical protein ACRC2H_12750 [Silanimonas sp.]
MSDPNARALPPPSPRLALAGTALAVALPLMVALWSAAALWLGAPAAWMAVVVAADASLLLGLLRVPSGRVRTLLAITFLILCTAASLWLVVAGIIGPAFGLLPWESAMRLGPVLFGAIATPWLGVANAAWLAAAVALTLWWNR